MSVTARRIAGAAALIAVLTVVARVFGFARIVVFYGTVGESHLGTVYQAANTLPNIIFEVVAGGALASLVVPMLAEPIARRDWREVSRTTSALLTWTLLILVPLAVLVGLLAGPVMSVLSSQASPDMVELGTRMLRVFAPQLPLYGIGIVLTGVLQAHQRFAWPALAPFLSSVTVIGSYAAFAAVAGLRPDLGEFTRYEELVLSGGTTLGVAVLSLCLVVPVARLGVRYRPTLRFVAGAAPQVRELAVAGAVTIAAQQLTLLLVVYLTYPPALEGSLVVYTFAQTVYFLPWGLLAVPVATSAYPALAHAAVTGDDDRYRRLLAGSTRAVLLLSLLGAAGLVAVAGPTAQLVHEIAGGEARTGTIAAAIAWFAPGLVGYSLFALLTRALYARRDAPLAARVTVLGWACVVVADLVLVSLLPISARVPALTAGNSLGMAALGGLLLFAVARRGGREAVAGTFRAGAVGLLAAVAAGGAGYAVASWLAAAVPATPAWGTAAVAGILSGVTVLAVFAGVCWVGDRRDARRVLAWLRKRDGGESEPSQDPEREGEPAP